MRRLRAFLEALGPAGVAGLGVALFCLPFYFSALAPAQAELERRSAGSKGAVSKTADHGAEELRRFYDRFPRVERLPRELETLYAHAAAARVQLMQGEYRLESPGGGLAAYHVSLPVRGTYPQLRQFVDRTLKDMPTTSLDALRFERKKAGDAQLDAQVRFTIFLRKGA